MGHTSAIGCVTYEQGCVQQNLLYMRGPDQNRDRRKKKKKRTHDASHSTYSAEEIVEAFVNELREGCLRLGFGCLKHERVSV